MTPDDAEALAKRLFQSMERDEIAARVGDELAREFGLRRSREYRDRWQIPGGTFTSVGLARRFAWKIGHFLRDALAHRKGGAK